MLPKDPHYLENLPPEAFALSPPRGSCSPLAQRRGLLLQSWISGDSEVQVHEAYAPQRSRSGFSMPPAEDVPCCSLI